MAENQSYAEQSKARMKEITDSIETGIQELFQSYQYRQYLTTMSRFHKYSVNNQMLIYMQKPDATLCAGFNKWRDQFERTVKKGERGIKIIAPTPYKKKIEQEKLDPDTKAPMLNPDGTVMMEEKTVQIPMYKVVTTFDVSQTEGKPLPTLAADLTGNVQNFEVFMEALRRAASVPIAMEAMKPDTDGYFSLDSQRIAIREGMSEVQTISATVHEIAHSKLHNRKPEQTADTAAVPVKPKSRETEEVEAESISFAVCAYYGIQTGENSFGYIATWSKGKELPELRASLETINKTASGLITDIDRSYAAILKERGLDKAEPEQTAEAVAAPVLEESTPEAPPIPAPETGYLPDPFTSIAQMHEYGYTDGDMLPLSKQRAISLFEQDSAVYLLYEDNTEAMAFDTEELQAFDGMFGISRGDWEQSREYLELAAGHELTDQELENSFLNNPADAFAIYQLKRSEDTRDLRFESLAAITAAGLTVEHDNYELVYTDSFTKFEGTRDRLEGLFERFNVDRPEDFRGHSLSVSDIVALKQNGQVSYHYVDSYDFAQLPSFRQPENHLKNAEMAMEDDYGMIDGIINNGPKQPTVAELEQQAKSGQPISLMDLAAASHRERTEKKPSVLEQLRSQPAQPERSKTALKKSAEREL